MPYRAAELIPAKVRTGIIKSKKIYHRDTEATEEFFVDCISCHLLVNKQLTV